MSTSGPDGYPVRAELPQDGGGSHDLGHRQAALGLRHGSRCSPPVPPQVPTRKSNRAAGASQEEGRGDVRVLIDTPLLAVGEGPDRCSY